MNKTNKMYRKRLNALTRADENVGSFWTYKVDAYTNFRGSNKRPLVKFKKYIGKYDNIMFNIERICEKYIRKNFI